MPWGDRGGVAQALPPLAAGPPGRVPPGPPPVSRSRPGGPRCDLGCAGPSPPLLAPEASCWGGRPGALAWGAGHREGLQLRGWHRSLVRMA